MLFNAALLFTDPVFLFFLWLDVVLVTPLMLSFDWLTVKVICSVVRVQAVRLRLIGPELSVRLVYNFQWPAWCTASWLTIHTHINIYIYTHTHTHGYNVIIWYISNKLLFYVFKWYIYFSFVQRGQIKFVWIWKNIDDTDVTTGAEWRHFVFFVLSVYIWKIDHQLLQVFLIWLQHCFPLKLLKCFVDSNTFGWTIPLNAQWHTTAACVSPSALTSCPRKNNSLFVTWGRWGFCCFIYNINIILSDLFTENINNLSHQEINTMLVIFLLFTWS